MLGLFLKLTPYIEQLFVILNVHPILHVWLWGTYVFVCEHLEVRGQRCVHLFLRQGLSQTLGLTDSARLSGHRALGMPLGEAYLYPACCDYRGYRHVGAGDPDLTGRASSLIPALIYIY